MIVCWMFICLQKCLNVSDVKFVPTSEISMRGPILQKLSLVVCTGSSAERVFTFFNIGNLLWYSAMQRRGLFLVTNTYALTNSQGLHDVSQCNGFSWGCICWYSKHMAHYFTMHSMSAFMMIQYTNSLARSGIFLSLCRYCVVGL